MGYHDWLATLPEARIVIPDVVQKEELDTGVYERLVEQSEATRHDVAFMLYLSYDFEGVFLEHAEDPRSFSHDVLSRRP